MNGKMLALLAGAAMLGSVGVASAAELTTLSEGQMDAVSAGAIVGSVDVFGYANYHSNTVASNTGGGIGPVIVQ